MLGLVQFLQKRPKDSTIRIGRVIFGFIYIGAIYYNLFHLNKGIDSNFFWIDISENTINIIKYLFIIPGIIPIVMGITNICLLKSKYIRIVQIIFSIILFYISSKISSSSTLDIDNLVLLMGFLPLIAGISGKCITSKCLKYGEKITKVRV